MTQYAGISQVIGPDDSYPANTFLVLPMAYHIDFISFEKELKFNIQALGWRSGGKYLPLQEYISLFAIGFKPDRTLFFLDYQAKIIFKYSNNFAKSAAI